MSSKGTFEERALSGLTGAELACHRQKEAGPVEWVACAGCGADEPVLLYPAVDRLHGVPGQFTLVRCSHCGLVYLNPRPTLADMARYYPADYLPYQVNPEDAAGFRRIDIAYAYAKRCRAVLRYHRHGTILDVGCSTGGFLAAMQRRGWTAVGVEPDPTTAAYARDRLGVDVRLGYPEQVGLPVRTFDVVTMWDVIEHLHAPGEVLAEVRRLLKPDGFFIASTPDIDSLDARLFGRYWLGLDSPRHLYVFSRTTLAALLRQAGLEPIEFRYFTGNYHQAMLSLLAVVDAHAPARLRPWFRGVVRFPAWRALFLPVAMAMNRIGQGPTVTVVARPATDSPDAHKRRIGSID